MSFPKYRFKNTDGSIEYRNGHGYGNTWELCHKCRGLGEVEKDGPSRCPLCGGRGEVIVKE